MQARRSKYALNHVRLAYDDMATRHKMHQDGDLEMSTV
jgi:hypothetical protein